MSPPHIVLASASPRRRELLSVVFDDFQVVPSDFDESTVPAHLPPPEHAVYSAAMKARDVARTHRESLVISADTIVVLGKEILGKPSGAQDAARMLRALSGKTHVVYTGLALVRGEQERSDFECTHVTFRELAEETISRYVATGEPLDKAGAYAIQGKGAVLIRSISGCYPNVGGLPLYKLSRLLEDFGIEVPIER